MHRPSPCQDSNLKPPAPQPVLLHRNPHAPAPTTRDGGARAGSVELHGATIRRPREYQLPAHPTSPMRFPRFSRGCPRRTSRCPRESNPQPPGAEGGHQRQPPGTSGGARWSVPPARRATGTWSRGMRLHGLPTRPHLHEPRCAPDSNRQPIGTTPRAKHPLTATRHPTSPRPRVVHPEAQTVDRAPPAPGTSRRQAARLPVDQCPRRTRTTSHPTQEVLYHAGVPAGPGGGSAHPWNRSCAPTCPGSSTVTRFSRRPGIRTPPPGRVPRTVNPGTRAGCTIHFPADCPARPGTTLVEPYFVAGPGFEPGTYGL